MEKSNIVVLGASGMLGYAVSEYFKRIGSNVICISRKDYDIAKDPIDKLERLIKEVDIIINCAGVIKPRIANNTIEDVIRVNSIFPRNLARLCKKNGKKCIHITTDCVYSGRKGKYTEEDYFDADDLYGMTKNAGETLECMTLRVSIIGEEKGQSRSLLEWAKSQAGREINGYENHWWNGVTTVYLAEIIKTIINKGFYKEGLFHIFSPDTVNKYELMRIINNIYDLSLVICPFQANFSVDRSLASIFNLSANLSVKTILQQVKELKEFFNSIK